MEVNWMDIVASIVGGVLGAVMGLLAFVAGLGLELYGAYKGESEKFNRWSISLMSGGIAGMMHATARKYGYSYVFSALDYNNDLLTRLQSLLNVDNVINTAHLIYPTQPTATQLVQGSTGGLTVIS